MRGQDGDATKEGLGLYVLGMRQLWEDSMRQHDEDRLKPQGRFALVGGFPVCEKTPFGTDSFCMAENKLGTAIKAALVTHVSLASFSADGEEGLLNFPTQPQSGWKNYEPQRF